MMAILLLCIILLLRSVVCTTMTDYIVLPIFPFRSHNICLSI